MDSVTQFRAVVLISPIWVGKKPARTMKTTMRATDTQNTGFLVLSSAWSFGGAFVAPSARVSWDMVGSVSGRDWIVWAGSHGAAVP
ncbi:hypothetical protein GCM10009767_07790 [Kocuria aegyptia]|uniref:Uncharacterized protein n=1 Tax=Kocuria aegyptia TaxID=330943 RepID=A0ABN2K9H5_9MICC